MKPLSQEAWEAGVKAATAALEEDPHHHKALWRRAKANEAIDSWSSLVSAQKGEPDLAVVFTLDAELTTPLQIITH